MIARLGTSRALPGRSKARRVRRECANHAARPQRSALSGVGSRSGVSAVRGSRAPAGPSVAGPGRRLRRRPREFCRLRSTCTGRCCRQRARGALLARARWSSARAAGLGGDAATAPRRRARNPVPWSAGESSQQPAGRSFPASRPARKGRPVAPGSPLARPPKQPRRRALDLCPLGAPQAARKPGARREHQLGLPCRSRRGARAPRRVCSRGTS